MAVEINSRVLYSLSIKFRLINKKFTHTRAAILSVLNSIIGSSQEVSALRKLISTVSKSDSTVLILGESGTGKDLAARALHESSSRKMNPFIPVNCGAIPKDLLESELFGHKKGSFTGAISDRKGRFQLAHQGTLF